MSAAAVAAGAMAVESQNVVGVVEREDGVDGYNWACGTFDAVGGGNISINQITLDDDGQYLLSDNALQVVDSDGYTAEYYYYTEIGNGVFKWVDENWDDADRVFANGEGFLIENLAGITAKFTGQVPEADVSNGDNGVDGYNWMGNPFPQQISINDITLDDDGQYLLSDNALQVVDPDGYTAEYYYYTEVSTGVFQWVDESWDAASRTFAPSEGFLIENLAGITATIAKPYTL
ncbi:MAG: hypothetical protein IKO40_01475 [Kiritimatiellae bacterium]|nr:hypothetical protein [Kiritimatiellia bacterium]